MCLGTAGTVVALHEIAGVTMAMVEFPFAPTQNCLSYVDSLVVGERVLVSGGAVLERVTEEEACERASFGAALLAAWDRLDGQIEVRSEEGGTQ
jgi:hydrogenase maturation factor